MNREPFRAKMLPPLENRVGRRDKLIALSRERFAVPRAKIDDKLKRWMATRLRLGQPRSALSIPHLNGPYTESILGWTIGTNEICVLRPASFEDEDEEEGHRAKAQRAQS